MIERYYKEGRTNWLLWVTEAHFEAKAKPWFLKKAMPETPGSYPGPHTR